MSQDKTNKANGSCQQTTITECSKNVSRIQGFIAIYMYSVTMPNQVIDSQVRKKLQYLKLDLFMVIYGNLTISGVICNDLATKSFPSLSNIMIVVQGNT